MLCKRANEILDLVNKTKAEFVDIKENITGNIHIGCGETEAFSYIAQITKEIQENYLQIHFHFYSGNAQYVMEKLDKGLFDFGIVIEPVNVSNYNYLIMPSKDVWGLLTCKDSPLATLNAITASHLANLPIICSRQLLIESLSKNNVINWLGDMATKLNIVATYNLIFNASILVREGVGYAITLDELVNTSDESQICFKPFAPKLESGLNIIWEKDQVLSNASKLFLEKEVYEFS